MSKMTNGKPTAGRLVSASDSRMTARLARRALRRLGATLRWRRSLTGAPILFANSFPKSGTHLLTQILEGFTALGPAVVSGLPALVMYDGFTGAARPPAAIAADLERLRPGDIAYGHLHAVPPALDTLRRPEFASFFILRDPRDVVVSHVHYVTEMEPQHIHHAYYSQTLQSFDERLATSIAGRPEARLDFPDIGARFAPFLGWLDCPEILTLRYEDFLSARRPTLGGVLDHATAHGFPLRLGREAALDALEAAIDPARSPTFRSGKRGEWRQRFTQAHCDLFKEVTGDLLMRLGYEADRDW
jgi:hypothetical protein